LIAFGVTLFGFGVMSSLTFAIFGAIVLLLGVAGWVEELRHAAIQPVLVTTAPLAEPAGAVARGRQLVKTMIGRGSAMHSIVEFNEWLRQYAAREEIPVFDLEAALRRGPGDRWMKPEYDAGDRVHLNAAGYRAMDEAFTRFLALTPLKAARR
ncbi:MAG TPA: SGNH/GDSL hydrolase family protein, partial [Usitatibacter sp.]|nr:SGNH/GDSL hydrolase family protein [Usitatibacter sp.]